MATLMNKKERAATNRDNHEDLFRNNQAWITISLSIQEDYITQVSEKIEDRVTKKCFRNSVGQKLALWVPY